MSAIREPRSRLFIGLAVTTAFLTLGLIVFGAVVRVTDSGLGCGNEWPTCHGSLIPPAGNITAWIEWLHRAFAVLIGLLGIGMLVTAIIAYRKRRRGVLIATATAAVLFALQATLGALTVIFDVSPTIVTLHLGTAILLFGALLIASVWALYKPPATAQRYSPDRFTVLAYSTTALSLIIILTGALVRGSGATLACIDWPLCNGSAMPFDQGPLATIHWLHRLAVVGLGVALVLVVVYAYSSRQVKAIRTLSVLSLLAYLSQAGVGAMFVFSAAAPGWGAAHVGMAALTWALLVMLSTVETSNNRVSDEQAEIQWQHQSEPALSR